MCVYHVCVPVHVYNVLVYAFLWGLLDIASPGYAKGSTIPVVELWAVSRYMNCLLYFSVAVQRV